MNLDGLVHNVTPMAFGCTSTIDRHGYDVLLVVAKMTWTVSPTGVVAIASPQSPVRLADVPFSDAPGASTRYPSDLCEEKTGTDVLLVGTAQPPAARPVTEMDVGVRIETGQRSIQKVVKVYGPRVFHVGVLGVVPGPPAELRPTPLVYESTYGGMDSASDPRHVFFESRNPAGRGFAKNRSVLVGQAAPQLEDASAPLSGKSPAPACFGPLRADWAPRALYAGTYDEAWRKRRAPLRPVDFDPRFHNVAPPDLWTETPLLGDEPVEVIGTTAAPVWRFRLPRYAPVFTVTRRDQTSERRTTHLDTYLIDADERRVEVTYRATVRLPRKVDAIQEVRIMGEPSLSEELIEGLAARIRAQGEKSS